MRELLGMGFAWVIACMQVMLFSSACTLSDFLGDDIVLKVPSDAGPDRPPPRDASRPPGDAPPPPPIDATPPVDAAPPVDAPPPDLARLCGAEPVTLDDWEDCYLQRLCEWTVGCVPLNPYRDVQECLDQGDEFVGGRLGAELRERMRALEAGRASMDEAAFARCLAETSGDHCTTARTSVACATRFTGTVDDGGSCYTDIECASPGARCESSCTGDACCLGTCQPRFREGEECDEFDSCEPGLMCHDVCLSGDIGAPCGSSRDCDANAWCNNGFCAADLPENAACTSPLQCSGDASCIGLSIVNPDPGRCRPISRAGDRCDYFCYGNLYCDSTGVCRDLPGLGESCPALIPCSGVDTFCSDEQCVLRGALGAVCSSTQPCQPGLFCTSALNDPNPTCALPGDTGKSCTEPHHCESFLCSGAPGQPGACQAWSDICLDEGS